MTDLDRRNTETVEAALKELTAQLYQQAERLALQQTALSSFAERLAALESTVAVHRAVATEHGPTVKT